MKTRNFPWKRALRAARAKQRNGAPLTDTEVRLLYAEASRAIPKDTRHRFGGKERPSIFAEMLATHDPAERRAHGRLERFLEGAEKPHHSIAVELAPSKDPAAIAAAPPGWQVWDAKVVGSTPTSPMSPVVLPEGACVRAYAHDCQCASCRAKPPQNTRGWEP